MTKRDSNGTLEENFSSNILFMGKGIHAMEPTKKASKGLYYFLLLFIKMCAYVHHSSRLFSYICSCYYLKFASVGDRIGF